MESKKDQIFSLAMISLVLIGISFVVLRRPAQEIEKIGANKAEITSNIGKVASQNDFLYQEELQNAQKTVFIEPADPLTDENGRILGLENSNLEARSDDFISDDRYKDVGQKLLPPRDEESLNKLFEALKGFGDFFIRPYEELIDPEGAFSLQDKDVVAKTKEAFRNPTAFALSQQCGLPGASFSFPPGSDVGPRACGGTPGFGGTSCNTSPQCYFSGKCFFICTPSGCSCEVTSCYGACAKGSYIWDSTTRTCGCGAIGVTIIKPPILGGIGGGAGGATTLASGLTVDAAGVATNSVAGVAFTGQYDPDGTTVMYDNTMTQAERDAFIANNPNALADAPPGTIIYAASGSNWDSNLNPALGGGTADAVNCLTCVNDAGLKTDGIFIDSSLSGTAAGQGYPSSFTNVNYSDMVLMHEIGHHELNTSGIGNDSTMQGFYQEYNNSLPFGGEQYIEYGPTNQVPSSDEYAAEVYALYKGSNGTYQPSVAASADIYNRTADYMIGKGILP